MTNEIRVHLVHKPDRGNIYMRYRDPFTGDEHTKTTGTRVEREAERAAARWEKDLQEGRATSHNGRITWAEFRTRFEAEHLATLREASDRQAGTVLDAVERIIKPTYLAQLNSERISSFLAELRKPYEEERAGGKIVTVTRSAPTIEGYRAILSMALNWASRINLIAHAPKLPPMSRAAKTKLRSKLMKGRPITEREFAALLEVVPDVVGADRAHEWIRYLKGMHFSGLRTEESLELYWDQRDKMWLDFSQKFPMMRVQGDIEKGGQDRLLPITPDFAAFLLETPEAERTGPVFKFSKRKGSGRPSMHWISHKVSEMGRKAKIVVDDASGKCVSLHDLRRSFGMRWARKPKVTPKILMELMRHEDISTTMKYYVIDDANETAAAVWFGEGDSLGDTPQTE